MAELCKQHDDYDKWIVVRPQLAIRSYFNAEGKYSIKTKLSSLIYAP
jgi:hypothetical protein